MVDKYCNLYDNEYDVFYPIEDCEENVLLFCNRLNELSEENEQLKKENERLRKELCNCEEDWVYEEGIL